MSVRSTDGSPAARFLSRPTTSSWAPGRARCSAAADLIPRVDSVCQKTRSAIVKKWTCLLTQMLTATTLDVWTGLRL